MGSYDERKQENILINNKISDPFYCGMSFVMMIPQFYITIYGQTSATK